MKKMNENYIIRRAESPEDGAKLNALFTEVFHPEEVGVLAETIVNGVCSPSSIRLWSWLRYTRSSVTGGR